MLDFEEISFLNRLVSEFNKIKKKQIAEINKNKSLKLILDIINNNNNNNIISFCI